jgi:hypothetical protein
MICRNAARFFRWTQTVMPFGRSTSKRTQRDFIKGLLEKKKIGAMESMSEEELQAQLAALG